MGQSTDIVMFKFISLMSTILLLATYAAVLIIFSHNMYDRERVLSIVCDVVPHSQAHKHQCGLEYTYIATYNGTVQTHILRVSFIAFISITIYGVVLGLTTRIYDWKTQDSIGQLCIGLFFIGFFATNFLCSGIWSPYSQLGKIICLYVGIGIGILCVVLIGVIVVKILSKTNEMSVNKDELKSSDSNSTSVDS